jgi:hypothetical protein
MRHTPSTLRRAFAAVAALSSVLLGAAAVSSAPAQAAPQWAPAGTATITPGVQMYTEGAQCTGNFVFTDSSDNVYVGYAAHCAGLGAATDTNGCLNESVPLGTAVSFNQGGSLVSEGTQVGTGTLVYSSWRKMRELGVTDANTCAYNDFALVKVSDADKGKVNPSIPFWGGPTGIDTDGTAAGDRVWSFGNSSLRGGVTELSPKTGISLGDDAGGKAIGTLSTLGLAPLPLSNNIGDLAKELAFAQANSGIAGLTLVNGTEPFNPIL